MGRRLINRQYYLGSRAPSMQMLTGENGIANLSPYLTINSTTVSPTALYWGTDATATVLPAQWGYSLDIGGSGSDPLLNQLSYGNGANDESVHFQSGKYYCASSTSFGDIALEDVVFEFVIAPGELATSSRPLFAKRTAGGVGYRFYINSSGILIFSLVDSLAAGSQITYTGLQENQWTHVMAFIDRSGSGQLYVNGVAAGSSAVFSSVGTAVNAQPFEVGANSSVPHLGNAKFTYGAMWLQTAWLDTHLQATVALERFEKWSGIYAIKATGSSAPNYFVRAAPGYVDKYDSSTDTTNLIYCSAGLPRVGKKKYGTSSSFDGILIEPQSTNLIPYSRDIDNAAWAKTRATIETSTGVYTPDLNVETQGIVASVDNNSHYIADSVTTTAENHTISLNAKKGSVDWVSIQISGRYCYFDLANGAAGMNANLVDYDIVDLGNGWYRVSITALYTAAAFSVLIVSGFADGTDAFAGDGLTVSTYISDIQMETGNKPTSQIVTAGASATRNADLLQYDGTTNVTAGQGTLAAEILVDTHTPTAELPIATISDGGSTDEIIRAYVDTGTKVPIYEAVDSTVSQWTITGTTDVIDSDNHTVKCLWESNNAKQYVDNVLDGTPDTSCTIPTGLDRIDVAKGVGSGEQLNGWIRDVKIFGFASGDV